MENKERKSFWNSLTSKLKKTPKTTEEKLKEEAIISPGQLIFKNFITNKFAIVGLIMFVGLLSAVFVLSSVYKLDVSYTNPVLKNISPGFGYMNYPTQLEKEGVLQIDVGASYGVGLSDEGNVFVWGKNQSKVANIPTEVQNANIVQIASGDKHILAVDDQGNFYGWGDNAFEQSKLSFADGQRITREGILKIAAGDQYSAVLTEEHNLYVWGSVLSNGLDVIPKEYQGHILDIKTTSFNMLLLLDDGTVAVTGVKGNELSAIPTKLVDGSVNVVQIAVSYRNGLALDDRGNLHVWGNNSSGILNIPEISGEPKTILAGRDNFIVLSTDGTVVSWGNNVYGQSDEPALKNIEEVYAGFYSTYVVDAEENITAWGLDGFIFGTDELGRDLFIRLLHGGRLTLLVGAIAVIITTILGVIAGLIAGFYGGWIDNMIMRFAEIISSFPFLPLAITLSALISTSLSQNQRLILIMCILGVLSWPSLARMVRGQILSEREKDYVLAARSLGLKESKIILKHILPNVINVVIVSMTLQYARSLLTEAGLSFLGFGVIPPSPSWGNMLTAAQNSEALQNYWWRWVIPALCVLIAALSINLIGDALREAMDPKSNEK
ncbi:MAG: ABC transporter permease subunit [Anaerorhabdus sp.]